MKSRDGRPDGPIGGGATTGVGGTPVPVDVARDRPARVYWVVVLAGPVIWFVHFMIVYLLAEAGCTGDGPGLDVFDPPVPTILTLAATAVAMLACVAFGVWGYRWWSLRRGASAAAADDRPEDASAVQNRASAGFAGLLLSSLSFFSILLVGVPAIVLRPC
ncbi:MAG: hypothetical protein M3214_13540 [Actinomycetota bacterium]|nr:hypothetical protein [Actinomycetota bacterium]